MQLLTREDVDQALTLFPPTGSTSDGMIQLVLNLHVLHAENKPTQGMCTPAWRVIGSFSTLLTILERHEWQKQQASEGTLDHTAWMFFSGCDVEHFYIVVRSLFDDLSLLCSKMAVKKGECPETFNDLFRWCTNGSRADRILGEDLAATIRTCAWFEQIRETRDGIVHFGAFTLALPGHDTVSFRVEAGPRSSQVLPELMTNENVGDFDLFCAWVIGNLAVTLDRVGSIGLARLAIDQPVYETSGRLAHRIARQYLIRLQDRLPAGRSKSGAGQEASTGA
jgi:hypothetical protein